MHVNRFNTLYRNVAFLFFDQTVKPIHLIFSNFIFLSTENSDLLCVYHLICHIAVYEYFNDFIKADRMFRDKRWNVK